MTLITVNIPLFSTCYKSIIDDYYEIEPNTHTGNLEWNQNFQLNPISNFSRDTELEEVVHNGWMKVKNDEVPGHSPFTDFEGLNFLTESHNLKIFSTNYLMN